jgi:hypothetical protein
VEVALNYVGGRTAFYGIELNKYFCSLRLSSATFVSANGKSKIASKEFREHLNQCRFPRDSCLLSTFCMLFSFRPYFHLEVLYKCDDQMFTTYPTYNLTLKVFKTLNNR